MLTANFCSGKVLFPNLIHYQLKFGQINPDVFSIPAVGEILHLLHCTSNASVVRIAHL
jgi:hypothetical protein